MTTTLLDAPDVVDLRCGAREMTMAAMRKLMVVAVLMAGGAAWADEPTAEDLQRCRYEIGLLTRSKAALAKQTLDVAKRDWEAMVETRQKGVDVCLGAPAATKAANAEMARQYQAAQQRANDEAKIKAAREAQAQAELDRRASDPAERRIAFSAYICAWRPEEASAMHEVNEIKKAAKIGGVIDMHSMSQWQDDVLKARNNIAYANKELRSDRTKPLACTDPRVALLVPCMTDEGHLLGACGPDSSAYETIAKAR
jgi:hypothetical protein